ncbi:MAG TPA: hypothetical protein VFT43_05330 [Candidatus Polarisedimenticolia bacterium]|nr:hypothetical protein [Candidatus Polarisedimenticolia bacterium]
MVAGEPIVSQAGTDAYREGYERAFGDVKPRKGSWVWDAERGEMVEAGAYVEPPRALDAPIIADRIHEGTRSPIDGSDIGSRAKRRAHMKAHGVEDASDASRSFLEGQQRAKERANDQRVESAFDRAARKLYQQGKLR